MKVAIFDSHVGWPDRIADTVRRFGEEEKVPLSCTLFSNIDDLTSRLQSEGYDILIMDMILSIEQCFLCLRRVSRFRERAQFIYLAMNANRFVEYSKEEAFHRLPKDYTYEAFADMMRLCIKRAQIPMTYALTLPTEEGEVTLAADLVRTVIGNTKETRLSYLDTTVRVPLPQATVMTRLCECLGQDLFCFVRRGVAFRARFALSVTDRVLTMRDGRTFDIPAARRREVLTYCMNHVTAPMQSHLPRH